MSGRVIGFAAGVVTVALAWVVADVRPGNLRATLAPAERSELDPLRLRENRLMSTDVKPVVAHPCATTMVSDVSRSEPVPEMPDTSHAEVRVSELTEADADRLARVNAALVRAGIQAVQPGARISAADLSVMRQVVDEAERRVSDAEDKYLSEATASTDAQRKSLLAQLARGEKDGLPLLSPSNPMDRMHPYEAITQVSYGGRVYVLRTLPHQCQALAKASESHGVEVQRRVADYTSMIVPLFR